MKNTPTPERKELRSAQRRDADLEAGSSLSIADVLQMLRRHLIFIVSSVIVCVGAALLFIKHATPIYQASAILRIDPTRSGSLGLNDLASGGGTVGEDTLETDIAVIQSDAIAIGTLTSLSDSDFLEYAGRPKEELAFVSGNATLSPAQEALLSRFKSNLSAKQVEGTQLVSVSMKDPDPRMAALLANHTISAYVRQSFDSRYGSVTQVTQWLSAEMETLRARAERSQRELADFQQRNNILMTQAPSGTGAVGGDNTTTERLRLLNANLTQAESERIVKEAQLRAATGGDSAVLVSMFPNPELTTLQTEQGRLYAEYAQLSTKFGANYPPLADVRTDLAKLNTRVDAHTQMALGRLRQEYNAALASENMFRQQYGAQAERAYALNRQQSEYAVLQAEVNSSRELFNTLQYKLQQAGVDAGLAAVNTMPLDIARVPLQPIEPKKQVILEFGAFLGLFVGVALAFLIEAASDKVQNGEQLERSVGAPLLVSVPHIEPGKGTHSTHELNATGGEIPPTLATFSMPASRESESFQMLRSSVLLSTPQAGTGVKTILVTSSLPSEGKSTVAANFAVALAEGGARVLLLDAYLRHPALHAQFGLSSASAGLGNLLSGELEAEPFVTPLPGLPNLAMLPAGSNVTLPSVLLSSNKFHALLEKWREQFDFVVLDSAPLLVVSDSLVLSTWVDATVLVARYNVSPVKALRRIREVLGRGQSRITGIILNDIPPSRLEEVDYAYSYSS